MCGFVGVLNYNDSDIGFIEKASESISHRGPNDKHNTILKRDKLLFFFRRLSIIDLSNNGRQPMRSRSKRYLIVFNGEIYNFKVLKRKYLKSFNSVGNSDTEIFINLIDVYGLEFALSKCEGMFSFALWDDETRKLYLTIDNNGEKPLYYYKSNHKIIFASELKAIKKFENINLIIDHSALKNYFNYGFVPAPLTIYKDVYKLRPGQLVSFDLNFNFEELNYSNSKKNNQTHEFKNDKNIINELDTLLNEAVSKMSFSDAPIGSLLSGGTDSSIISAIFQSQKESKIDTFSLNNEDPRYDESKYSSGIARQINSRHHTITLTKNDYSSFFNMSAKIFCEPFSDSSQIPTYFISKYSSKKVKVVLSGDGADELFCGYNRYIYFRKARKISNLIKFFRVNNLLLKISPYQYEKIYKLITYFSSHKNLINFGDKITKLISSSESKNSKEFYNYIISVWKSNSVFNDHFISKSTNNNFINNMENFENIIDIMNFDLNYYLPNDMLVKVDRASMACGLETRLPFLDAQIKNFANKLPEKKLLIKNNGKVILKKLLEKYISKDLIYRPKMGFSIPIDEILRNELFEQANLLINKKDLYEEYFDCDKIQNLWKKHINKQINYGPQFWNLIIFLNWRINN